jgi:hypothetical protein
MRETLTAEFSQCIVAIIALSAWGVGDHCNIAKKTQKQPFAEW